MAAAQNGIFTFVGRQSGRVFTVDAYFSDAAAALVTFNPSGLAVAGSPPYWRSPEAVVLVDFAVHTGMTETGCVMTEDSAVKNGAVLKYVPFLDTIANRPKLNIPFNQGSLIGATQL